MMIFHSFIFIHSFRKYSLSICFAFTGNQADRGHSLTYSTISKDHASLLSPSLPGRGKGRWPVGAFATGASPHTQRPLVWPHRFPPPGVLEVGYQHKGGRLTRSQCVCPGRCRQVASRLWDQGEDLEHPGQVGSEESKAQRSSKGPRWDEMGWPKT